MFYPLHRASFYFFSFFLYTVCFIGSASAIRLPKYPLGQILDHRSGKFYKQSPFGYDGRSEPISIEEIIASVKADESVSLNDINQPRNIPAASANRTALPALTRSAESTRPELGHSVRISESGDLERSGRSTVLGHSNISTTFRPRKNSETISSQGPSSSPPSSSFSSSLSTSSSSIQSTAQGNQDGSIQRDCEMGNICAEERGEKYEPVLHKLQMEGHRGYGHEAPHNSMRGFKRAVADPLCTSVEFDVRETKDGVLVISHGKDILEHDLIVEDLPWDDVRTREIAPGSNEKGALFLVNDAADETSTGANDSNGELHTSADNTIPTLSEVVDLCMGRNGGHQVYMNVEIKEAESPEATEEIVRKTIDLLRKKNAIGNFKISSFSRDAIIKVKEVAPEIPVGILYNDMSADKINRNKTPEDFLDLLRPGMDWVHLCVETIVPQEVVAAKAKGIRVMAWSPGAHDLRHETLASLQRLEDMGVSVVCSNHPSIWRQRVE